MAKACDNRRPMMVLRHRRGVVPGLDRFADLLMIPVRSLSSILVGAALVAVVDVGTKVIRLRLHVYETPLSWLQSLSLLGSEACSSLGLLALMLALAALCKPALPRLSAILILLPAFVSFLAVCLAHGYFVETGGPLSYDMVEYGVAGIGQTLPLLASGLRPGMTVLLLGIPCCLVLVGVRLATSPAMPGRLDKGRRGAAILRGLACMAVALAAYAAAGTFKTTGVETGFVRDPAILLVQGFLARHSTNPAPTFLLPAKARRRGAATLLPTARAARYNVAIIFLESARADATSPYPPGRDTTPSLLRLARDGTIVDAAYTVVPATAKAVVTTLCGFEPQTGIILAENQPGGIPGKCLPQLLREAGYSTIFFQSPYKPFERHADLARNLGFHRFLAGEDLPHAGFEAVSPMGYEDAILLEPHRRWLHEQGTQPFLAAYLTNASHFPYTTPKSWPKRHLAEAESFNAYLNALGYVDSVMGKLIAQYREAGLFERTLFIVLGDHGEGFGEHGLRTHTAILHEEGIRIPLVLRVPAEQQRPRHVSGPVNQLSVVPTVLDVLGLQADGEGYEAASIFERPNQEPVYLACFRNEHCLAAVREHHKLIYYHEDQPPKLYDLRTDPEERDNIASKHPARVRAWVKELIDWQRSVEQLHRESSHASIAKFVARTPPANVQNQGLVHFSDLADWLGFSQRPLEQGKSELTMYLHVNKALPAGYHWSLELRKGEWPVRVHDELPVYGLYPYDHWQPGDYIANPYRIMAVETNMLGEACLQLRDDRGRPIAAFTDGHATFTCAPLSQMHRPKEGEQLERESAIFASPEAAGI